MRHIIQYARYGARGESFRLILLGDIHLVELEITPATRTIRVQTNLSGG